MSLTWMARWNAAVRFEIAWLIGGCGSLAAGGEITVFVRTLVLVGDTFRLRTCGGGVAQMVHPGCEQWVPLVHVL